jgi:hypothetical protein
MRDQRQYRYSIASPDKSLLEGKPATSLFGTQIRTRDGFVFWRTWKSMFQRSPGQRAAKKWQPSDSMSKFNVLSLLYG